MIRNLISKAPTESEKFASCHLNQLKFRFFVENKMYKLIIHRSIKAGSRVGNLPQGKNVRGAKMNNKWNNLKNIENVSSSNLYNRDINAVAFFLIEHA